MKSIDLGAKSQMKVKHDGEEYIVGAPTVEQVEEYQQSIKEENANETQCFRTLLEDLGMPGDVSKKLDVVQLRKLSEGLMGLIEKK